MQKRVKEAPERPLTKGANAASRKEGRDFSKSTNSPADSILFFQRNLGNRAVQRLFESGALQGKLKVGGPGDVYEQEADRIAEEVMRMPETGLRTFDGKGETIQTKKESGQGAGGVSGNAPHGIIPGGGGRPLSESVRSFFEPRLGSRDLSGVRLHTDTRAAESASALNATAFTCGRDIYFGEGRYQPETQEGKRLMAHELTHVAQQGGSNNSGLIQRHSRAREVEENLEFWDTGDDAVHAVNFLSSMNRIDFNDTITSMTSSGSISRLIDRLPSRSEVVRFLHILADKGSRSNQESVFSAVSLLNLSAENSLIVFGRRHVRHLGARGPVATSSMRSSLISTDPSSPFTGAGARGIRPSDIPMGLSEMWDLRSQANDAAERYGGLDYPKYTRVPGLEMIYDWSNPIKGDLMAYVAGLSSSERTQQAQLLFGQEISTAFPAAYAGVLPSRIQVVRAAAATHNLEPELVSGIILAEQRDQSLRETAADFRSATVGQRSASSIGLGQVTVRTAQRLGLFADLLSPQMQRLISANTAVSRSMIPGLLASDEFNIFAVARYLRHVANIGSTISISRLPNTRGWLGPINLQRYSLNSTAWTEDHIRLIGSEYTSRPFDDVLVEGWGDFVLAAYRDVKGAGIF